MTTESIITNWLDACCLTIANYDHAAHMNLISKQVKVFGIPGFDVINYQNWFEQCEQEFKDKLIKSANYEGLKVCEQNDSSIMFVTHETITATDGAVNKHDIEVVLTKEEDAQWRVTQERLLSAEEMQRMRG